MLRVELHPFDHIFKHKKLKGTILIVTKYTGKFDFNNLVKTCRSWLDFWHDFELNLSHQTALAMF